MNYIRTHAGVLGLPFASTTMLAVLGAVVAIGGSYGGYEVYKRYQGYGANFDGRKHMLVRVFDGDTIAVVGEVHGGAPSVPERLVNAYAKKGLGSGQVNAPVKDFVKVRLLGIDAPEIGTCYADEAKKVLEEKLAGVQFITQKDEEPMDELERLLRHVFIVNDDPREGMRLVNEELLREGAGFAKLDTRNSQYDRRYAAAEREARAEGRGVWGACKKEVDARVAADARLQRSFREEESAVHKPGCDIKGNISTKGEGKVYYLPRCPNYHTLILDAKKGEQYFCTEAEAKKAGFHRSGGCENTF